MSNAAIQIDFPTADVRAMFAQIRRAERELGRSQLQSIQWAARLLLSSLSASTKVAPKLRRIVKNPDKGYLTDRRKAPFGVMVYKNNRKIFKPIYRTGEYGKLRFYDKKSVAWFKRDAANPKGKWEKIQSGPDIANPDIVAPGIMTDKRRKIGRRGFAKLTWNWAKGAIGSGGTATLMNVPNIASVKINRDKDNPGITIINRINYMHHAMKSGEKAMDTAMLRAADNLRNRITRELEKKMGAR